MLPEAVPFVSTAGAPIWNGWAVFSEFCVFCAFCVVQHGITEWHPLLPNA